MSPVFRLLLAVVVAPAWVGASGLALTPCQLPGVTGAARCGTLEVPENPDRPESRRIQIGVAVLPATGKAQADPVVPLMGGPGESTISEAAYFAEQFAPLRSDHDILLVDQRGTGRSSAIRCDLFSPEDPAASLRDLLPLTAVEKCVRQLAARADLTQYTYLQFSGDLERVRTALGYGKLNLSGGSYGTRAAQVFLRTHPESVRTVYFGSVVPLDIVTSLTMAKSAQASFDLMLAACEADDPCRKAYPKLREELRELADRLDSGNVRVAIPGRDGTFPLYRGRVMEWFRSLSYRPATASQLPWLIHRAYQGDYAPLVEGLLDNARGADQALSFGVFLAITCSGDIAFMTEQDIVRESRGTLLGDFRPRQQQAACALWPGISLPADYRTPLRSAVPALFVSGDLDAATPLWMTEQVTRGFSNRAEVVLRGRGHTDVSDCIPRIYGQFVRSGEARGLDTSACKQTPRPPFKTGP